MKKTLFVLMLAMVLVFAFTATAQAKYAGWVQEEAYLSWGGANQIKSAIEGTTTDQLTPHGGYTQTSVKCAVCHSIHRAFSDAEGGFNVGGDYFLLNGVGTAACAECHAAWGASPSDTLVAVGENSSGPHIGTGGASCANRGCHGSVHGVGQNTKYATVARYNLANPRIASDATTNSLDAWFPGAENGSTSDHLTYYLDSVIASGNVAAGIGTTEGVNNDAMKAFVTGYVCTPCHPASSFTVATNGFANMIDLQGGDGLEARTGHPSATGQFYTHAPTCEKCHDLVDVASNSTAFPHANRGIDVYESRKDYDGYSVFTQVYGDAPLLDPAAAVIPTTQDDATRYSLWMTSSADEETDTAYPIAGRLGRGGGYNLQDGACLKCHDTDFGGAHALP
jgi:hypothetical protein